MAGSNSRSRNEHRPSTSSCGVGEETFVTQLYVARCAQGTAPLHPELDPCLPQRGCLCNGAGTERDVRIAQCHLSAIANEMHELGLGPKPGEEWEVLNVARGLVAVALLVAVLGVGHEGGLDRFGIGHCGHPCELGAHVLDRCIPGGPSRVGFKPLQESINLHLVRAIEVDDEARLWRNGYLRMRIEHHSQQGCARARGSHDEKHPGCAQEFILIRSSLTKACQCNWSFSGRASGAQPRLLAQVQIRRMALVGTRCGEQRSLVQLVSLERGCQVPPTPIDGFAKVPYWEGRIPAPMSSTTEAKRAPGDHPQVPEGDSRIRRVLGSPIAFLATALILLALFGWTFIANPDRVAPTKDPAYYTWRTELITTETPETFLDAKGPYDYFSSGYRVTAPVTGALMRAIPGVSELHTTVFFMVLLPVLTSLLLAGFAFRHRRDPLLWHAVAFLSASLYLTSTVRRLSG